MRTFVHQFANGIIGSFIFDRSRHFNPETLLISPAKDFSRSITDEEAPAMFAEYREWLHVVNSEIAVVMNSDCLYVLADSYVTPPLRELWLYEPGGGRRLLASTA